MNLSKISIAVAGGLLLASPFAVAKQVVHKGYHAAPAVYEKGMPMPQPVNHVVESKNNVEMTLSGQINVLGLYVNDGYWKREYFGTNNGSTSRVNLDGVIYHSHGMTVAGHVSLGLIPHASSTLTQTDNNGNGGATSVIDVRRAEVSVASNFGTLYLGKGYTGSYTSTLQDLSGTDYVTGPNPQDYFGDFLFRDSTTAAIATLPTIGGVFTNNDDSLARASRLRYDTPKFAGFTLVADVASANGNNRNYGDQDIALFYDNAFSWGKIKAGASYTSKITVADNAAVNGATENGVMGKTVQGSFSGLLNMGLNVTVAGGKVLIKNKAATQKDPRFVYGKLGYIGHWFSVGTTNLAADYGVYKYYDSGISANYYDSRGKDWGIVGVQNIDSANLGVYAGFHQYKLKNVTGSTFKNLNIATLGAMYKF